MEELPVWIKGFMNLASLIGVGFAINKLGYGTEFIAGTPFLVIGMVLLIASNIAHVYWEDIKDYLDDDLLFGITPQMVVGEITLLWISVWFFS